MTLRPGLFPMFIPGSTAYPGRGQTLGAKTFTARVLGLFGWLFCSEDLLCSEELRCLEGGVAGLFPALDPGFIPGPNAFPGRGGTFGAAGVTPRTLIATSA